MWNNLLCCNLNPVTTTYYHNSHADMFFSRLLQTDTLDGRGSQPSLKLASLFTDQAPENDVSRKLSQQFESSGRVAPVFCDKHLSDNWQEAKWIYDEAKSLKIPLMAGSSLPVLWRYPPTDVERGASLKQIVATSYHRLDTYGFHALEAVQALAERRHGGETGIARVRCLSGPQVWQAEKEGLYDRRLLDAALSRLKEKPLPEGKRIEELAKNPDLLVIDYKDGLRA